jgi:hypothetical protein
MINKHLPRKRLPSMVYKLARRRFLESGVAAAALGLFSMSKDALAADENIPPHVPSWMKEQGAPAPATGSGLERPRDRQSSIRMANLAVVNGPACVCRQLWLKRD